MDMGQVGMDSDEKNGETGFSLRKQEGASGFMTEEVQLGPERLSRIIPCVCVGKEGGSLGHRKCQNYVSYQPPPPGPKNFYEILWKI